MENLCHHIDAMSDDLIILKKWKTVKIHEFYIQSRRDVKKTAKALHAAARETSATAQSPQSQPAPPSWSLSSLPASLPNADQDRKANNNEAYNL